MSFFKKLLSPQISESEGSELTGSVKSIVNQLSSYGEEEGNKLASFAYLLGRVAHADLNISAEEMAKISQIIGERSGLDQKKSEIVSEMVKSSNELFGATDKYIVAREFYKNSNYEERMELMKCLFAVSAADDSISGEEERELKRICSELRIHDEDFLILRSDFREYREVLKGLKK